MVDAGFHEAFAVREEAVAGVEVLRRDLRVQRHLAPAAFAGGTEQCHQQGVADAAAAPGRQYGHAPDLVLGRQASGADRVAGRVPREDMDAPRVQRVPLQLQRHPLLLDEDGFAHRAQVRQGAFVIDGIDPEAPCVRLCESVMCISRRPRPSSSLLGQLQLVVALRA